MNHPQELTLEALRAPKRGRSHNRGAPAGHGDDEPCHEG